MEKYSQQLYSSPVTSFVFFRKFAISTNRIGFGFISRTKIVRKQRCKCIDKIKYSIVMIKREYKGVVFIFSLTYKGFFLGIVKQNNEVASI